MAESMMICLTCQHWRITEKDRAGRLKLHEMAAHKLGSCEKVGSWYYTPRAHQCEKWQAASDEMVAKRKQVLSE